MCKITAVSTITITNNRKETVIRPQPIVVCLSCQRQLVSGPVSKNILVELAVFKVLKVRHATSNQRHKVALAHAPVQAKYAQVKMSTNSSSFRLKIKTHTQTDTSHRLGLNVKLTSD